MSFSLSEEANINARLGWRSSFYCENTIMSTVYVLYVGDSLGICCSVLSSASRLKRGRIHLRYSQTFVRVAVGAEHSHMAAEHV